MSLADRRTALRASASSIDERAVAALALGASGLFIFNIVFGPLAIALGAVAAGRRRAGRRDRLAGWAGVALGVADLVVLAILTVTQMYGGGIPWPS